MKENFKLGAILLIITSIAGLLLGFANDLTKEAILENSKLNKEDLKVIMPQAESIEDSGIAGNEAVTEIFKAKNGNEEVGYVFKVTTKGFHGPVDLVVAISNEDVITGMKVMAHSETPGLGAKIVEEEFRTRFNNLPTTEDITMVKTAPAKDSEVSAITGATVSSNAIGTAVTDALRFYKENIKGEEVAPKEESDATTAASSW
ncbi:MAG: RnfABCDGE type electron transport complex subunit G [Clostridium sp.]